MPDLLGVFREPRFSPGRVDDDAAILTRTADALAARGLRMRLGDVDALASATPACILAMCQSASALTALERHAARAPVINTPEAIRHCHRRETVRLLAASDTRFPTTRLVETGSPPAAAVLDAAPCWVKRGDVHAMAADDVVHAATPTAVAATLAAFAARGIPIAAVQEHVAGTVVKFYGVIDGRFFRSYTEHGEPPVAVDLLWRAARAAAAALGLEIFGGDLVVTPDGAVVVIDVNDWPSFARCRDEAAEAIAAYACDRLSADARTRSPAGAC